MNKNEFQEKYNLNVVDPLLYNAISILIKRWANKPENKNLFGTKYTIDMDSNLIKSAHNDAFLNIKCAKCKDYYNVIIEQKQERPTGLHTGYNSILIT